MNIAVPEPGRSFELRMLSCGEASYLLPKLYRHYEASGDGLWSEGQFAGLTDTGNLHHVLVTRGGQVQAVFGLQLMRDMQGQFVSFAYYNQVHGRLADVAQLVIACCFAVASHWHWKDGGGAVKRFLLKGRSGWQLLLPRP